jgi:hypothetical protein
MSSTILCGMVTLWDSPYPLQWGNLILVAVTLGSLLAFVAIKNLRDWLWLKSFALALFNSFYGLGVAMELNQDLDHDPPKIERAHVMEKRETNGRHSSYYLKLGPWGPRRSAQEMSVRYSAYRLASKGADVCIEVHPGAFRATWIKIETWE